MLHFAAPQWLLLLPGFALLGWLVPRLALWYPLRALCLVLLCLAMAKPLWQRNSGGMDLWVLVDRSASAVEEMEKSRAEVEGLLQDNAGTQDRLFFVDFAAAPVQRVSRAPFEPSAQETRLRLAIDFALARRDDNRPARILLLGDGQSTEDLEGLEKRLSAANVPLDLRLSGPSSATDPRVGALSGPTRVQPGQGFLLTAEVYGSGDETISYEALRNGQSVGRGEVTLKGGRGEIRLAGRLVEPGAHRYDVRIYPSEDARSGNNVASAWVEAVSEGSILVVTGYENDPLPALLQADGWKVDVITEPRLLHVGMLVGPRNVIFNNIPAHRIPADFLAGLEFFVTHQGGGFLMAGGKNSFGAGGYFESPVDPLLPVSMELREEHRKLAVAMALVLDRSGSMAAGTGSGGTKMDMANEGAARSISLLSPMDAVTVLAVDSEPHTIVPLARVGENAGKMGSQVRRIQSAGGGIFVYTGLKAAWEELKKAPVGQRHIILFADAADAEEPGDYEALLEEVVKDGATVSVIGLGKDTDTDADFLRDVAARGQGRIFFNSDAAQLPALFAQETVAIARSAFLKENVSVVNSGGWSQISASPLTWLPQVNGYNLSYLKPEASVAAISGDDYKAPLVTFWQRGAGRTAAISFPIGGEHSEDFRAWNQAADFERTLIRWLQPGAPPPGTSLRTHLVGNELVAELLYDESWNARLAAEPPRLVTTSTTTEVRETPWERMEPGRFSARIPVPAGDTIRGVIQIGKERWTFGPLAPSVDPEWQFRPEMLRNLRNLSAASGGQSLTDLRDAWTHPPATRTTPLDKTLLWLLLAFFLLEVFLSRWRGRSLERKA